MSEKDAKEQREYIRQEVEGIKDRLALIGRQADRLVEQCPPDPAPKPVGEFGEEWTADTRYGSTVVRDAAGTQLFKSEPASLRPQVMRAVACVNILAGINPAAVGPVLEWARSIAETDEPVVFSKSRLMRLLAALDKEPDDDS